MIVHLTDDIDGSVADKTIQFGWESKVFEMDLNAKNAAKIEKLMAEFVPHARQVRSTKSGKRLTEVKTGPAPSAVRAWAAANGVEVNRMGKIPEAVVEQYRAAGN